MYGQQQGQQNYSQYNHGPGPQGPPPQVPPPWRAEWDPQSQRWYFVNQQDGERRWEFPNANYYNGPPNQAYGATNTAAQNERGNGQKHGGSGIGMGIGAAAVGLIGGALLMHEGHEVKEKWERDEYRAEERLDDGARWTGEKIQEAEDIPHDVAQGFDRFGDRVEQGWDNTVDYVADAPERIAEDAGQMVGGVERFGDRVEDSYDEGRYEAREDDYDRRGDDRW